MVPDIKLKDYYCNYVYDAETDIESYNKEIESILIKRDELQSYITENIDVLKNEYGIDLSHFEIEWNEGIYNESKTLYKLVIETLQEYDDAKNRGVLIQLLKYCKSLEEENEIEKLKDLAYIRKDITFAEYKKYVTKFYNKVQQCALEGNGYVFDYGLGTFLINYWKLDKASSKAIIDFAATNKRKREILASGKRLYDEDEARFYKERGVPYDGVQYKVYKKDGNIYEITFINSKVFGKRELEFQRTEYVHLKFRGMSYQEIADNFVKTFEDIVALNVDLKYKLNIMLYLEPTNYLKFIRNAEQSKYKY